MVDDTAAPIGGVWVKYLSQVGVVTLLCLALVGYFGGYWVRASDLTEVKADRDTWKKMALDGLLTAESAKRIRMAAPDPTAVTPDEVRQRLETVRRLPNPE